ncbi:UNKNOWN [Stylonychia lemnae]|uniref:Uncharacterized protein n=1 Tax=Stylonychia lemnae TaxID=5949 RepID=A0A078BDE1_STYLE|nr:UNKNOWN [Stylonychia lemnae]|eukprot:CDW91222.1 UNKNOWN [Stylonychia lemnae]
MELPRIKMQNDKTERQILIINSLQQERDNFSLYQNQKLSQSYLHNAQHLEDSAHSILDPKRERDNLFKGKSVFLEYLMLMNPRDQRMLKEKDSKERFQQLPLIKAKYQQLRELSPPQLFSSDSKESLTRKKEKKSQARQLEQNRELIKHKIKHLITVAHDQLQLQQDSIDNLKVGGRKINLRGPITYNLKTRSRQDEYIHDLYSNRQERGKYKKSRRRYGVQQTCKEITKTVSKLEQQLQIGVQQFIIIRYQNRYQFG